jgi:nitrite reductase/ring-hydroxylating ferredoxin subunit
MDGFVAVGQAADVPEGEVRGFRLGGLPIAVYNIDGSFYATEDRCTHGLASLSEGMVDGELIECPLHFGAFNIKTGAAAAPPCSIAIRTFQVREEDGQLLVEAPA